LQSITSGYSAMRSGAIVKNVSVRAGLADLLDMTRASAAVSDSGYNIAA